MSHPAQTKRMTGEEFEIWEQTQDERHEFVDGLPQLKFVEWDGPRMMVGATNGHNRIVLNVSGALAARLRDNRCQPYAADGKVRIPRGNFRYPDVAVNCGPFDRKASHLANPVAVIEVLSKSTHWLDHNLKLRDYQSVPSIQHILLLSQDEMRGALWTRGDQSAWGAEELSGPEAVAAFPAAGVQITLAEAYYNALD